MARLDARAVGRRGRRPDGHRQRGRRAGRRHPGLTRFELLARPTRDGTAAAGGARPRRRCRRILAGAVLSVAATTLAACSGDDAGAPQEASTTTRSPAGPADAVPGIEVTPVEVAPPTERNDDGQGALDAFPAALGDGFDLAELDPDVVATVQVQFLGDERLAGVVTGVQVRRALAAGPAGSDPSAADAGVVLVAIAVDPSVALDPEWRDTLRDAATDGASAAPTEALVGSVLTTRFSTAGPGSARHHVLWRLDDLFVLAAGRDAAEVDAVVQEVLEATAGPFPPTTVAPEAASPLTEGPPDGVVDDSS